MADDRESTADEPEEAAVGSDAGGAG